MTAHRQERAITMTKTITVTHSGTVTAITPKNIVVFLPTLELEVDVPIRTNNSSQNVKIPEVGDTAAVQVTLRDGDAIVIAAIFAPQQNVSEDISTDNDDLLLLDDNWNGNTAYTQQQYSHHANQLNPNNSAYTAAMNNHANQCNPNNPYYRGNRSK